MTTISSIDARYAQNQIGTASNAVSASVQNLVSGTKQNANVADLAVGTILASRVNTLTVAVGNAGQATNLLKTAQGAISTIQDLLQQQKSLAVKASDASLSDTERGFLNQQFQALVTEIDSVATNANFNGVKLLDGSIDGTGAGIADVSTATGITNEQDSLLNASQISSTGTVPTGNLATNQATIGSTVISFGAGSTANQASVNFTIDSNAAQTGGAQTVTYATLSTDTGAQIAAKFVAAANASTSSNFNQFSFTDNKDGTVTVTAKQAGAALNNYTFLSASTNADGAVHVGGAAADSSGAAVALNAGTGVGGTNGIFQSVAANNIGDTALTAVITLGADTLASAAGTVNGVKRVQDADIGTALASTGTARQTAVTITGALANGNTFTFGTNTISATTGTNNATNFDPANYTTVAEQAAIIADKLNALSAAGTGSAANYTFAAGAGTGTITATRKDFGDGSTEIFGVTGGTISAATTTAGVAATNDTITFGGVTVTARSAGYDQIATQTLGATDLDTGTYTTPAAQAARLADIFNAQSALGNGTTGAYTFSASGSDVIATAKNFGTPGTQAFVLAGGAGGVITPGVATAAGSAGVAATALTSDINFTVKDAAGNTVGQAVPITIAANTGTTAYTATQIAGFVTASLNAANTSGTRLFTFTNNNDGTIGVTANTAGTDANNYSFKLTSGGADATFTASVGGTSFVGSDITLGNTSTGTVLGTNKNIAPSDLTFDPSLEGSLTGLAATFKLGAGNNGINDGNNNTVQFSVNIGGKTYTSQNVVLTGDSTASTISNTIAAGTLLTFTNASGPTDTTGAYTNGGFQISTGASAITLASVTNSSTGQNSLNTIVAGLQTQLNSVSVNSNRSLNLTETDPLDGDNTIAAAKGTILQGIKGFDAQGTGRLQYNSGDITLNSDAFSSTGTQGRIGQFTIDPTADTISTTVNGTVYTAYLNSTTAPITGGVEAFGKNVDGTTNNGSYNTATKVLTLGSTAVLNFYSAGTTDGNVLSVKLGNVAATSPTIDISTTAKQTILTNALDTVLGVQTADSAQSSLSFQVGTDATDNIDVKIGSAKTSALYVDSKGVAQTIDVSTLADAQTASNILDTALNTVVALSATVNASVSAFAASIENNQSGIQNADAARSTLLDTDYTAESTNFATARVRVDAATSVLSQINTRIQNLLQLLRQ